MRCPFCGSRNTICIDSRPNDSMLYRRRRRYRCNKCERRFSTVEISADVFIEIQKNINKLEQIDNKLEQINKIIHPLGGET